MDDPVSTVQPFLAVAWLGALLLLWAGVSWLDVYKSIAKLRRRGGGAGIDASLLQEAALLTGLGLVVAIVGLGLHSIF